ncbi:MAG: hypothetical protein CMH54_10950 [Myxococcales bacterium]|nr:hypothetical protein [Myxococcales bacterium]
MDYQHRAETSVQRLIPALLVAVLFGGCALFKPVPPEPKSIETCRQYKRGSDRSGCENYCRAKKAYADGRYKDALAFLEWSNLAKTPYGRRLERKIRAAESSTTQPDLIDPSKVTGLAILASLNGVCPGRTTPMRLELSFIDGTKKRTWTNKDKQQGFIDFDLFELESPFGTFNKGLYVPQSDFRKSMDRGFLVRARLKSRPEITATRVYKPTYDCFEDAFFSGRPGATGRDGKKGHRPRKAGRTGSRGKTGGTGPKVVADVGVVQSSITGRLVVVKLTSRETTQWIIRPMKQLSSKSPIRITVQGGPGGDGGLGGAGADGARGGRGGHGGRGGKGGALTIRYDKKHRVLRRLVRGSTPGGLGGQAGIGGRGGRSLKAPTQRLKDGRNGRVGKTGRRGPRAKYRAVRSSQLFRGEGLQLK